MIIPFILSVIAWPIITYSSIPLLTKLLMPTFVAKAVVGNSGYSKADIFQAISLIVSQIIVVLVAQGIYTLFQRQATAWLAIPFGLWCFFLGPFTWQISHYLKAKYEGVSPRV